MKENSKLTVFGQIIVCIIAFIAIIISIRLPNSKSSATRVLDYSNLIHAIDYSTNVVDFSLNYSESQSRLLEVRMEARFYKIIHSRAFDAEAFVGIVRSIAEDWNDEVDGRLAPMEMNDYIFSAYYVRNVVGIDFLHNL